MRLCGSSSSHFALSCWNHSCSPTHWVTESIISAKRDFSSMIFLLFAVIRLPREAEPELLAVRGRHVLGLLLLHSHELSGEHVRELVGHRLIGHDEGQQ